MKTVNKETDYMGWPAIKINLSVYIVSYSNPHFIKIYLLLKSQ